MMLSNLGNVTERIFQEAGLKYHNPIVYPQNNIQMDRQKNLSVIPTYIFCDTQSIEVPDRGLLPFGGTASKFSYINDKEDFY